MEIEQLYKRVQELFHKKDRTAEELLELISATIELYALYRDKHTDRSIENIRTVLSYAEYEYIYKVFMPAMDELIKAELKLDKGEAEIYLEHIKQNEEKYSVSRASEIARKTLKMDKRYLKLKYEYEKAKQDVKIAEKVFNSINQILNSMAKRAKQ